jgi:hypothetical protein
MTQKELGVHPTTLWRLKKDFSGAPMDANDVEAWKRFVGKHLAYDAERRRNCGPSDGSRKSLGPSSDDLRREKIIKLRLANTKAREELALIKRETVSAPEAKETLEHIKEVVSDVMAEMNWAVAPVLAGKSAAEIQQILEAEIRKALDRLSRPEIY